MEINFCVICILIEYGMSGYELEVVSIFEDCYATL